MASIKSITVKGFRNILSTTIDLQDITCLLAPNNYGKSNILSAIGFGYNFMISPSEKKTLMMQSIADISINKSIAGKPFVFTLEGSLEMHFAPRLKVHKSGARFSIGDWVPSYLFDLKKEDKSTYDYLLSAIQILLPNVESMEPIPISLRTQVDKDVPFTYPDSYDIMVKEVYNNQATRLQYLSTGSMKILFLLTCIIRARKEGTQLLFIEELENSIHPNLMQALLSVIVEMKGDTKLLFTSHSPNVAKYLTAKQLYVGLPSDKGVVDFRTIKPSKVKSVLSIAGAGDMALGEYLFELMLDTETDPSLIDLFFTPKNEE